MKRIIDLQSEKRSGKTPVVTLSGGLQITIGQYIFAHKRAKENQEVEFARGLTCWYPVTGREILNQFMDAIHDRINLRGECKVS